MKNKVAGVKEKTVMGRSRESDFDAKRDKAMRVFRPKGGAGTAIVYDGTGTFSISRPSGDCCRRISLFLPDCLRMAGPRICT